MRTDVKIGIAVGFFVLLIAVLYVVGTSGKNKPSEIAGGPTPTNAVERATPTPLPTDAALPTGAPLPTATPPPLPTATPTAPPALSPTPTPVVVPPLPTPPAATGPGAERMYAVARGDSFYTISTRMYGNGKYWELIAKANPHADAAALREGQKLVIPPLPASPVAGGPTTRPGSVGPTLAAGHTAYTVKDGDAGLWGIAQTVYGNGKYWTLIAKANPNVRADALHAGQLLDIPPKPDAAAHAGGPTTRPGIAAASSYIVQKDDTLYAIAEKVYGDGKYWTALAGANPEARTNLHEGMKLAVPALGTRVAPTTGPARATPPTTTGPAPRRTTPGHPTPAPRHGVPDNRPDFG